jgi:hypothetical protein
MNLKKISKKNFKVLMSDKLDKFNDLDNYIINTFNLSTKVIVNKNKFKK